MYFSFSQIKFNITRDISLIFLVELSIKLMGVSFSTISTISAVQFVLLFFTSSLALQYE